MAYLMIRNPGVADHRGFTLLGVSTTRNAGQSGTIGQFGSGSKYSIALLLRLAWEQHGMALTDPDNEYSPILVCGNLKLKFFVKLQYVKGQEFRQVCVKYAGKDLDGASKTGTEDLGFTLEWGVQDWKKPQMAFREFVANAIDGSIVAGGTFKAVEFAIVDDARAKQGHTAVFLPLTAEVESMYHARGTMFLHFSNPALLKSKCLPKRIENNGKDDYILIYKHGVLVNSRPGKSVFDYNLGDELTLDESRNASEWDVKYAVSKALQDENADNLASILKGIVADGETWEAKLDPSYLANSSYSDEKVQARRKEAFKDAWVKTAGPKAVATSGSVALSSFVQEKGFTPVQVPAGYMAILESYEVPTESKVLSRNELDGKVLSEATEDMLNCTKRVWALLEAFNLCNGKEMPKTMGFTCVMDGSSQTHGYYIPGGDTVYLHTNLGVGKMMFKVCLEEVVHYTTGSDDKSRDIQDFLFNLVTEMAF